MHDLKVSTTCIWVILNFETWQHKAYDDGYGYLTIGVGNRKSKPKPNTTITSSMVWWLFVEDLKDVQDVIEKYVKVELNQHEYDAIASFVFNIGSEQFRTSSFLKLLNQNKKAEAAKQLPRWIYSRGKKSQGLIRRRSMERTLFEGTPLSIV